jgi:hypothetical protein
MNHHEGHEDENQIVNKIIQSFVNFVLFVVKNLF